MMIKEIQKKYGLSPDGIFGEKTAKAIAKDYNIKNPALFFGQICHETNDLKLFIENLNYSANGLLKTFPKYFKSLMQSQKYANKPNDIANLVYGGRMGNKNPNDGYYFRGRGAIQLTGRNNYKGFENWLVGKGLCKPNEIMLNPDLVYQKFYIDSAIYFFDTNNLWGITDVKTLTKRINGGTNGLNDRISKTEKYKKWF